MILSRHEAHVRARFDALQDRFRSTVALDDYRLRGVIDALGPIRGRSVLDLGCGKGRFARALAQIGAGPIVGLDLSAGMLAQAAGIDRVRASASRLPFAASSFDAVVAIEVFEHLDPVRLVHVINESRRVLRPGGRLVIVDKCAGSLDARRPWLPSIAVKRLDESRGRWMYAPSGPVRERWFWPGRLLALLRRHFGEARIHRLLSPEEEKRFLFRLIPAARLMALWVATRTEAHHV